MLILVSTYISLVLGLAVASPLFGVFLHVARKFEYKSCKRLRISHGRRYNSLLEWYGGGAVPPMIAFSGKYG